MTGSQRTAVRWFHGSSKCSEIDDDVADQPLAGHVEDLHSKDRAAMRCFGLVLSISPGSWSFFCSNSYLIYKEPYSLALPVAFPPTCPVFSTPCLRKNFSTEPS